MKGHARRPALALVAALLLLGACTSQTKSANETSTGSGASADKASPTGLAANNTSADSTVGITDDKINVAFIGVDFSALESTGLVPELGDQEKQVKAIVDDINANGGVGGRQIDLHLKIINYLEGGADVLQAACIEATQEFKAAVVILPPAAARDLARCTAVTNKTLTIDTTAFDQALFEEAQGRLFATGGMSIDRQYRAWVDQMDDLDLLKGKKIGIVAGDQPAESLGPIKTALVPELEDKGYEVTQNITLPCSGGDTSCEQYDAAAQKLKDAGVDVVFMTLSNTFGPPLVQAAANIGYHPQWLLEGNQATNTVSKFYESVKADWDGSVGVGFSFNADPTTAAQRCNQVVSDGSGEKYAEGSDAFGFTAIVCISFDALKDAADSVPKADLDQGTLIAAIEDLGSIPGIASPDGTLSATKHDALDYLFLCDYKASSGTCVQRSGPPIRVAD
jgi:ABC-type branched-subunit amino acid transport system substrate-binding protein